MNISVYDRGDFYNYMGISFEKESRREEGWKTAMWRRVYNRPDETLQIQETISEN